MVTDFYSEILLRSYPDAVAILIDHSKPMIEAAREHMNRYKNRCKIYQHDLSHSIEKYAEPHSIDCIVSGFAIHHLPNNKKKLLYKDIYKLLTEGGIFINIEHTASASPAKLKDCMTRCLLAIPLRKVIETNKR